MRMRRKDMGFFLVRIFGLGEFSGAMHVFLLSRRVHFHAK